MSVVLINGSAPRDGLTNLFLCHLEGLRAIGGNVSTVTFIDPGLPDQYPYTGERIHGRRFPGSARATMALNRMIPVYARKAARCRGSSTRTTYISRVRSTTSTRLSSPLPI